MWVSGTGPRRALGGLLAAKVQPWLLLKKHCFLLPPFFSSLSPLLSSPLLPFPSFLSLSSTFDLSSSGFLLIDRLTFHLSVYHLLIWIIYLSVICLP